MSIRYTIFMIFFSLLSLPAHADITAKTEDGQNVILSDDFTWKFAQPEEPKELPDSYVTLSLLGMEKSFLFECQLNFRIEAHNLKLMNLSVTNYFNYYDEDGDYLPIRGLGDRTLYIDEPFKDGQSLKKETFSDDVACDEISEIVFEPIPNEDTRITCSAAGGESEDCAEFLDNMIGTRWQVKDGRVVTFEDSLGGADFKRIQELLLEKGYDIGKADGKFGKSSRKALIEFKKSQGLPENSEITKDSLTALGFY